ncbi:MAG: hypothetical protein ACE5H4_14865 [Candidatus Thorarchaeota archaeon]
MTESSHKLGTTVEEFHSDLESSSEEEFRGSIKRGLRIGAIMCVAVPLLFFTIILTRFTLPGDTMLIVFIALIAIGTLGILVVVYYGTGSSMLFRGMGILRQMSPPEPFIEGKVAVLNKDPVYAIAQWGSNVLFFVGFYESERSFDKSVVLPRVIWKWEYIHPIGNLKVARREGDFTIPVDRDTYYKGRGILYSLLLEQTGIVTIQRSYTAEQLNQIVDRLAQEVTASGSSSRLFDDDLE